MASRSPDAAVAGATVLVTGAHGFIGRAVVAEVHSLGARPVCPYRPDAPPSVIGSSYALARAWSSATDHGAPHPRRTRTHAARGRAEFDPQVSRQPAWVTSASRPAASTVTAIRIHPSSSHSRMRSTASSGTSQVAWNWCPPRWCISWLPAELHPSTGRALANAFDREDQTRLRRRAGRSGHQPGRRRHRVARGRS